MNRTMDYQTYMNNSQNIIMMYQDLITVALVDNNPERVEMLIKERNEKLDELRQMYFSEAYKGKIINLKQEN